MREFKRADYEIYIGAEPFRCGEEPMIHELPSGLDLVMDASGVTLQGYVGTRAVFFGLFKAPNNTKKVTESAAKDWIEELEYLAKHEQIALLNGIGIKGISG